MTTYDARADSRRGAPQLEGIDYVEFYVGNARQAMHFYQTTFGFKAIAYAGFETGVRDRMSFAVEQDGIRLLLTAATGSNQHIAEHVKRHGEGVKDIAFRVSDARHAFEESVERGAEPIMEPTGFEDGYGRVIKATVGAYGDTVHSFIQRRDYDGVFLPGFRPFYDERGNGDRYVTKIDHIAISVETGGASHWSQFYDRVFGFHESRAEDTATEYSGMNSRVVQNGTGCVIFVLVEPVEGKRKSPIEEYLVFYEGPGVHHIALSTDNIVGTVRSLRSRGIEFTNTPPTYYEMLEGRVGQIDENVDALREEGILVDRDANGYLMQIFSKPVQSRPTFFFEIIQRKGSDGFGSGNIKALFEAIARDQEMRGNA
jgi:4-hydroxyphenylpyruvate dioxygenase